MNKKVMVIAVHPDDETLGCGGTILRHKQENDEIHWIIITNISERIGYLYEFVAKRQVEIEKVHEAYCFNSLTKLDLPTTQLDKFAKGEIISYISDAVKRIKPEIIYFQYSGDAHSDHTVVFDAVMTCAKSFRYPYIKEMYAMETLSETEFSAPLVQNVFIPNYFVDITNYIDKKIEIMKIYESEIGEHPFPRSERNIRALATYRGAVAGVDSAEAFMCLKYIR
jgi:LmbE family N-acetylglucosaminyl deacetylase